MPDTQETNNHASDLALEKLKNKYQLILAVVSGFFATGLAALLVFLMDVMKETNREAAAGRQFSSQYAPQIVSGEVEDRLRVAEFWSRISETEKERSRWKAYESHLQDLVLASTKAQEERDSLQAQIEELRAKPDAGPDNSANAETIEKLQTEYVKANAVYTGTSNRLEQRNSVSRIPRIYVHISNEAQRRQGHNLISVISRSGLGAKVDIENVGLERSPAANEFRYFHRSEEIVAHEIYRQLKRDGFELVFTYVPGFENANIRENHFEIWLKKAPPT